MNTSLRQRVAGVLGREPVSWKRVERGYTPAARWVLTFADGSTAFAKIGTTPLTAEWVRAEHRWYSQLRGDFLPDVYGLSDDPEQPMLLLEDLSHAHWPPPWEPGEPQRVLETLRRMAATRPLPENLPLREEHLEELRGWTEVARDPEPFLALGLSSREWLARALPALLQAQASAVLAGEDLIHFDVRSDNLCLLPDRVVLVDWNRPMRGNHALDLAFWAPTLRLEGGPLPEEILPDAGPLAALVSGFFAARAGLPAIPDAPRVRWIQLRQLKIALPWAARALGLPPPDLPWGRNESARLDAALESGALTEEAWHEEVEEMLADAYLASADPRAQSGKGGDETEWRWSRELILEAMPGGGSLLDVGCANGYLMESLHRWGEERGLAVEPFGLDISWRLASLARQRIPRWAERIWVGNVLTWAPPRGFDLVHTGLDYVPPHRRRELVERLLREFLTPGGRLVFRAERVREGVPDLVAQVRGLGFEPGGVIERAHPQHGLRRTVWLAAPGA